MIIGLFPFFFCYKQYCNEQSTPFLPVDVFPFHWNHRSQSVIRGSTGVPLTFLGDHEVKTTFLIILPLILSGICSAGFQRSHNRSIMIRNGCSKSSYLFSLWICARLSFFKPDNIEIVKCTTMPLISLNFKVYTILFHKMLTWNECNLKLIKLILKISVLISN